MNSLFDNDPVTKTAEIDGTFRYRLSRTWADGPKVLWVLLNPSTATADKNDPTIRRCIGLTKAMGEYCAEEYGGIEVVNLYAFRATHPADLKAANYPISGTGDDNDNVIRVLAKSSEVKLIIAAWGSHAPHARVRSVFEMLHDVRELQCYGWCKCGCPRHPLMLPDIARFAKWDGLPKDSPTAQGGYNRVGVFLEAWRKLYHRPYDLTKKDAVLLCKMSAGLPEAVWRSTCHAYLNDPNPSKFTSDNGHPVGAFFYGRHRWLSENIPT